MPNNNRIPEVKIFSGKKFWLHKHYSGNMAKELAQLSANDLRKSRHLGRVIEIRHGIWAVYRRNK